MCIRVWSVYQCKHACVLDEFFSSQFPRVHYLVWWVRIKGYRIGVSFWVRVSFGVMIRVRVDVMVRIRVSKLLGSD